MQKSIRVGQGLPLFVSKFETIIMEISNWLYAKNESFSAICGENVTVFEVIVTNVAIIAMFLFVALMNMIVTFLEGGAV